MPTTEEVDLVEEEWSGSQEVPEVEVRGDEAIIRLKTAEGTEERTVKLPEATWA